MIGRDAFLYLGPPGDKQCGSCWLYRSDLQRCAVLSPELLVRAEDSCGYWGPVMSAADVNEEEVVERFTPEEVGFVKHAVRCENCVYFDDGVCGLFEHLNEVMGEDFDLDTAVDAKGCCNAQTPREENMPSKSASQARLMAAAAHNPAFAKRTGVPQDVAREYNAADKRTGILRKKKPKK